MVDDPWQFSRFPNICIILYLQRHFEQALISGTKKANNAQNQSG